MSKSIKLIIMATWAIGLQTVANALCDVAEALLQIAEKLNDHAWLAVGKCKESQL